MSLVEDLQISKKDLSEFKDTTQRVLEHLPNVI